MQRYRASWHKDMAIGSSRDDGHVLQYCDWEYRVTKYSNYNGAPHRKRDLGNWDMETKY